MSIRKAFSELRHPRLTAVAFALSAVLGLSTIYNGVTAVTEHRSSCQQGQAPVAAGCKAYAKKVAFAAGSNLGMILSLGLTIPLLRSRQPGL
jgi:hypothetical protein